MLNYNHLLAEEAILESTNRPVSPSKPKLLQSDPEKSKMQQTKESTDYAKEIKTDKSTQETVEQNDNIIASPLATREAQDITVQDLTIHSDKPIKAIEQANLIKAQSHFCTLVEYTIPFLKLDAEKRFLKDLKVAISNTSSFDMLMSEIEKAKQVHRFLVNQNHQINTLLNEYEDCIHFLFRKEKLGFPDFHIEKMAKIAEEKNLIFAIRPVDALNKTLLEEGYATKPLAIKPKSANWGPMAGFIPAKQEYSKLEKELTDDNWQKINRFNEKVIECINLKHTVLKTLEISKLRIDELVSTLNYKIYPLPCSQNLMMEVISPSDNKYSFELRFMPLTQKYQVFINNEPLEVLCAPNNEQAMTADYDLLFVSPQLEELCEKDNIKYASDSEIFKGIVDMPRFSIRRNTVDDTARIATEEIATEEIDHQAQGNLSIRMSNLVKTINKALDRENNPVVHHGPDQFNPVTSIDDNFPAITFLPKKIKQYGVALDSGGAVTIINTRKEFSSFVQIIKNAHYDFTSNPQWGRTLCFIKRETYTEKQIAIEEKLGRGDGVSKVKDYAKK